MPAVDPLSLHAAVLDEEAGRAVLELDAFVIACPPAIGADIRCCRQDAAHLMAWP